MNELNERLYETSKFVVKMLIAGLILHFIIFLNFDTYYVQAVFTSMMATLLSVAGLDLTYQGIRIFTSEATYVIIQDCLGWKSMAAFIALMWASTKRTVEHLNFILIGLGILIIGNIVRVFSTVYLAEIGLVSFDIIHDTLWRWSLTVLVLGMWAFWLRNFREKNKFERKIKEQIEEVS